MLGIHVSRIAKKLSFFFVYFLKHVHAIHAVFIHVLSNEATNERLNSGMG